MTRLQSDLDVPEELPVLLQKARTLSLRELDLTAYWKPTLPMAFDPSWLEPLRIGRLHLMGRAMSLPYGEPLARLTELWVTPGAAAARSSIDREYRPSRSRESSMATPALRSFPVRQVSTVFQAELILEQFSVGSGELNLDDVPARHRPAFAHLND